MSDGGQNQGVGGSSAGAASPDEPGTHASIQQAAGYAPHGRETAGGTGQGDAPPGGGVGPATTVAQRFPDPGLPAHVHRIADTDVKAARRAERQVTALFLLSVVGTLVFVAAYFLFPLHDNDDVATSRLLQGLGLGVALFCIGAGAVHWAKKLMPDDEVVEERHPAGATAVERVEARDTLAEGAVATGFPRRRMIWGSLSAALGAVALPAIIPLRDLWQQEEGEAGPVDQLSRTMWAKGVRLHRDPGDAPIRPDELEVGTVVHVLPAGIADQPEPMNERAKAAVLLMRLRPEDIAVGSAKGYEGIVAYSEICTHLGCPVALYEQQTRHLLCPCHQSTFDVPNGCKVIFGPAARSLPQLAITVDPAGYLVAQGDFDEPVGPSFWERG